MDLALQLMVEYAPPGDLPLILRHVNHLILYIWDSRDHTGPARVLTLARTLRSQKAPKLLIMAVTIGSALKNQVPLHRLHHLLSDMAVIREPFRPQYYFSLGLGSVYDGKSAVELVEAVEDLDSWHIRKVLDRLPFGGLEYEDFRSLFHIADDLGTPTYLPSYGTLVGSLMLRAVCFIYITRIADELHILRRIALRTAIRYAIACHPCPTQSATLCELWLTHCRGTPLQVGYGELQQEAEIIMISHHNPEGSA